MGDNDDLMSRKYHFALPYTISSLYVHYGVDKFKGDGLFQRLPEYLQHRFQAAADAWQGLEISERDCNAIDDDTWTAIAKELNLNWSA